jgi:hypothetical protein|tara:strand:+ start:199 stop:453 length:255 start_codon:yes stop_codon:yes gene_type:complete
MKEQPLLLNDMRRGALYRNEVKNRTERYIGRVSKVRPVMDFHKKEQEAVMIRDIRLANKSEVTEYIEDTEKNSLTSVKITRSKS